jgi:tetratricopeptide (TPR) repeat protein
MATVPVPSGTELSGTIWAIVIAGTVVVILLVGGLVHLRRRRHDDLQVDDLLALADAAAEGGQFDVAREWAARARKILPDSPRVLVDHGFFSAECGDFDAALEAYERAAERSEDGEPEFLASQLLLKHFGRADEAATLLLRALRKAPELAFEADEVPEFAALKTRLEVRLALERSRRRAGSG